jgi:hypothetical protein
MGLSQMKITDWDKHFENNRTRDLKHLAWVPFPNKQDGDGYTELLEHPNGAAHLGAWCALVQVASKCGVRGTLLRDGGKVHDSDSLARMTRIPGKVWNEVLPRLAKIGWIETCTETAPSCGETAPSCGLPEQNRTEQNRKKNSPAGQDNDDLFWAEIEKLYSWVNVKQERAKMQAWLLTPKGNGRKITRKFVLNWLNKMDKPMDSPAERTPVAMSAQARYEMVLNDTLLKLGSLMGESVGDVLAAQRKKHGKVIWKTDAIDDAIKLFDARRQEPSGRNA